MAVGINLLVSVSVCLSNYVIPLLEVYLGGFTSGIQQTDNNYWRSFVMFVRSFLDDVLHGHIGVNGTGQLYLTVHLETLVRAVIGSGSGYVREIFYRGSNRLV